MLSNSKFILYLTKDSKMSEFTVFSLKAGSHFLSLFYFSFHLIIYPKNYVPMYLICSTLIQKRASKNIPYLAVGVNL